MRKHFSEIAFTASVKAAQRRYRTRQGYARLERAGERYGLGARETAFVEARDGFYQATVGENGWPYVQFRGGRRGFLRVIDDTTLGYADLRGNGQYISTGNLHADRRVALILMDYPNRQRLKIWAEARIVEASDDPALRDRLAVDGYPAKIERLVLLDVQAYDWNCPQHITPRYAADELNALFDGTGR